HDLRLLRSWADHGEVTAEDVEHLRKLVDVRRAEHAPERRHPEVAHRGPLLAVARSARLHGAELQDLERGTVPTGARLSVEQWPPVRDEITHDDKWDDEREHDCTAQRQRDVEEPLQPPVPRDVELAD